MRYYKGDIHIHTVLSPCGDLEMGPKNIVRKAVENDIAILGISDHNSTRQCETVRKIAEKEGVFVLSGAEITTKEEVHCLVYFEDPETLREFDQFVYEHLQPVPNDPDRFGYQAVVDENEMILDQPEKLLIGATDIGIDELSRKVYEQGGIFIPAHIDRTRYGIIGQLGFIPPDLQYDALELSKHTTQEAFLSDFPMYEGANFIHSSDAHFVDDIGVATTHFYIDHLSFEEIRQAFQKKNGRLTRIKK